MPWLFYDPDVTENVLTDLEINTVFQPGAVLTFLAAKYSAEGKLLNHTILDAGKVRLLK